MTEGNDRRTKQEPDVLQVALRAEFSYSHGFGDLQPFFEGLGRGVLMATRCETCARQYCPPRFMCACGGNSDEWVETSGSGTLRRFTVPTFAPKQVPSAAPTVYGLIEIEGCSNLFFARLDVDANAISTGARLVLSRMGREAVHPIENAVFRLAV